MAYVRPYETYEWFLDKVMADELYEQCCYLWFVMRSTNVNTVLPVSQDDIWLGLSYLWEGG